MRQHIESTKNHYLDKEIKDVVHLDSQKVLFQFHDDDKLIIDVEGDCCSRSYFYSVELPDNYDGAKILSIEQRVCDENTHSSRIGHKHAVDRGYNLMDYTDDSEFKVWDILVETDRGNIRIRHINESNGYYDGDIGFWDSQMVREYYYEKI